MSTRKPHTKSRKGCIECKRRHNKCDETHPTCSSCTRLGVECIWPDVIKHSSSHCNNDAASSTTIPQKKKRRASPQYLAGLDDINRKLPWPCLDDDARGPAFTAEDMQLLHHFSTETYATLDTAPAQHGIWQRAAIRIGFKHRFVLRGLLAVAALHLACSPGGGGGGDSSPWIASSSVNFNLALIEFRQVLGSSSNNNNNNSVSTSAAAAAAAADDDDDNDRSAAIFLFATTVVVHALAIGQTQHCADPVADMAQCIRTVRGTASVVRPSWEALLASEVAPLALNGMRRGGAGAADDVLALKEFVAEHAAGTMAPGEDAAAYAEAIGHLHDVAREARGCPAGGAVLGIAFTWPVLLDDAFFSCLADRRPVAVLILLNFTALLERSTAGTSVWWLSGWHRRVRGFAEASLLPPALMKWVPE